MSKLFNRSIGCKPFCSRFYILLIGSPSIFHVVDNRNIKCKNISSRNDILHTTKLTYQQRGDELAKIKSKKIIIADLGLALVAVLWGGGFVAVKDAVNERGSLLFDCCQVCYIRPGAIPLLF